MMGCVCVSLTVTDVLFLYKCQRAFFIYIARIQHSTNKHFSTQCGYSKQQEDLCFLH